MPKRKVISRDRTKSTEEVDQIDTKENENVSLFDFRIKSSRNLHLRKSEL